MAEWVRYLQKKGRFLKYLKDWHGSKVEWKFNQNSVVIEENGEVVAQVVEGFPMVWSTTYSNAYTGTTTTAIRIPETTRVLEVTVSGINGIWIASFAKTFGWKIEKDEFDANDQGELIFLVPLHKRNLFRLASLLISLPALDTRIDMKSFSRVVIGWMEEVEKASTEDLPLLRIAITTQLQYVKKTWGEIPEPCVRQFAKEVEEGLSDMLQAIESEKDIEKLRAYLREKLIRLLEIGLALTDITPTVIWASADFIRAWNENEGIVQHTAFRMNVFHELYLIYLVAEDEDYPELIKELDEAHEIVKLYQSHSRYGRLLQRADKLIEEIKQALQGKSYEEAHEKFLELSDLGTVIQSLIPPSPT